MICFHEKMVLCAVRDTKNPKSENYPQTYDKIGPKTQVYDVRPSASVRPSNFLRKKVRQLSLAP